MCRRKNVIPILAVSWLMVAVGNVFAQIKVNGKVIDSAGKAISGVDVAIYVPGSGTPVKSQASRANTGEYSFSGLKVTGAFDIVFTHSKYRLAIVSRLAERESQRICKVLYRQGEPLPATAFQDYLSAVRRVAFLASATTNTDAKQEFLKAFEPTIDSTSKIWDVPDHVAFELVEKKDLSEDALDYLRLELHQTEAIRRRLLKE